MSSDLSASRCPCGNSNQHYHVVKVYHRNDSRLAFGRQSFTPAWWDWLIALREAITSEARRIDVGILGPPPGQPTYQPTPAQLPGSLYVAIAEEELRPLIDRMELGEQLPPAAVLAAEFGVSRSTMVRAFRTLKSKGLLTTVPGQGIFVASHVAYDPEHYELLEVHELEYGRLTFGGTYSGRYRDWLDALRDAVDRALANIDADTLRTKSQRRK